MFKTFFPYFGQYKKYAILTPILVIIEVFMNIAIPYLMSLLIDRGILGYSKDQILKIGIILIIATLISLFSGITSGITATRASAGLAKNLRFNMFKNICNFSFRNLDEFKKGSIVTRMSTDVQYVQMAMQMSTRIAVRAPLTLLFAFIMSFRLQSHLAIYFVLIIPIISLGMAYITRRAYPIFQRVFKITDDLNTMVSENLLGIRVVKSYVREDKERENFNHISQKMFRNYRLVSRLIALSGPLMQFSTYLMSLIIAWLGSHFIVRGTMSTGALTSMITYSIQIQISLLILSMVIVQLTIAKNASQRIMEVINTSSDILNPIEPIKEVVDGSVEFKNVNFSYNDDPNKLVLKDINLKISSGDYVGIIGPTGSSKSTLVQLIPRLYDVYSGSVLVGGIDVKDYDLKSLRDEVSFVLQHNVLFSGTLRENLKWADENLNDEKMLKALKVSNALDFINAKDGLDTIVERGGTNFSGGQKQRLCIARAILKNPKVLIMDDCTSALDNSTESSIINSINTLNPHLTKILISQRVNSLKNCNYIIVLNEGKIENIGSHENLIKSSEIYREIYESQQKGGDFDVKE
ncbi:MULTISPECIES: ABC transporter ATP-binding protein [Peptoniphilus]|uniref:ABC transporter ATP-binding protein n=1 Tax=Peptoniphilus TaxID=162289 RepID=UPI0001DCAB6A|nr:ABC transporter ATP-binding protein [Peptoniphilus sp. oral taxon 836]EFK38897.1 ABC transporter, ATP-binding protein [Peptoniphilus sp. oral taxon 836 str. F0141]